MDRRPFGGHATQTLSWAHAGLNWAFPLWLNSTARAQMPSGIVKMQQQLEKQPGMLATAAPATQTAY